MHYLVHKRLTSLAQPFSKVRLPKTRSLYDKHRATADVAATSENSDVPILSMNFQVRLQMSSEEELTPHFFVLQEGELTLKLLTMFFDSVTKFQNMDAVLQPIFYELVSKTVQQLHVSKDKEGYLDLLLTLFRTIQVRAVMPVTVYPVRSLAITLLSTFIEGASVKASLRFAASLLCALQGTLKRSPTSVG